MAFALDRYVEPVVRDIAAGATSELLALRRLSGGDVEYTVQCYRIDQNGYLGDDLSTSVLVDKASSIKWDCTAAVPESIAFQLKSDVAMQWGIERVKFYALIRSTLYNRINGYDPATWLRFPLPVFVCTTPGFDDMDKNDLRAVTGYGLNYLLQSAPKDSYAFDHNVKYVDAVWTILNAAGVADNNSELDTYVDYSGTWGAKQIDQPVNYPLGSQGTYLDIINDLLKSSGQRPLYTQFSGRWRITAQKDPSTQTSQWTFAGSTDPLVTDDDIAAKTVIMHNQRYAGDVHGIPNKWIFVQNGLDFPPVEGSGQYSVVNAVGDTIDSDPTYTRMVYQPPADQQSVGRVIADVEFFDATGQAELVTQGDAFVTEALSQIEQIEIHSTPWPCGGQYDVFYFVHNALPNGSRRLVQAQSWEYFLFGDPTVWETNVVAVQ